MKDLLTYVSDLEALRSELETCESTFVVDGKVTIDKCPVIYKGISSLSLCRCNQESEAFLEGLNSVTIIGEDTGDEEFEFKSGGEDIYGSMYDQSPQVAADEDGTEITYDPPKKFCVFA